ncbi:hypothetical protein MJG53_000734 [Ovis ammon polii x Ovis aries]|uniref:Uncharacterized protein n=1 Tax=Ovis ammon polii x Ovis aries TaxID=2918886 RepID=A0ACB9VIK7_9CETA|nr:hypothetical protein MJG53_000734 [Ovis ammon polii x Ovis aries]
MRNVHFSFCRLLKLQGGLQRPEIMLGAHVDLGLNGEYVTVIGYGLAGPHPGTALFALKRKLGTTERLLDATFLLPLTTVICGDPHPGSRSRSVWCAVPTGFQANTCPVLSSGIFTPNLLKGGSSGKKMTTTCHPYAACFWFSVVVPSVIFECSKKVVSSEKDFLIDPNSRALTIPRKWFQEIKLRIPLGMVVGGGLPEALLCFCGKQLF